LKKRLSKKLTKRASKQRPAEVLRRRKIPTKRAPKKRPTDIDSTPSTRALKKRPTSKQTSTRALKKRPTRQKKTRSKRAPKKRPTRQAKQTTRAPKKRPTPAHRPPSKKRPSPPRPTPRKKKRAAREPRKAIPRRKKKRGARKVRRRFQQKPRPPQQSRQALILYWYEHPPVPLEDLRRIARELNLPVHRSIQEWRRDGGIPWERLEAWAALKPWEAEGKRIGEALERFLTAREKHYREVTGRDWRAIKRDVKKRWGEREARMAFDWVVDEYDLEDYIVDYDALWET